MRLFLDHSRILNKFLIGIQIFEQVVHDIARFLLVHFRGLRQRRRIRLGLLWFQRSVEHELVDGLVVFSEFFALFAPTLRVLLLRIVVVVLPDFAAVVLVAKAFVVNDEVVVFESVAAFFVFVLLKVLKNVLLLSNLQGAKSFKNRLTAY